MKIKKKDQKDKEDVEIRFSGEERVKRVSSLGGDKKNGNKAGSYPLKANADKEDHSEFIEINNSGKRRTLKTNNS